MKYTNEDPYEIILSSSDKKIITSMATIKKVRAQIQTAMVEAGRAAIPGHGAGRRIGLPPPRRAITSTLFDEWEEVTFKEASARRLASLRQ